MSEKVIKFGFYNGIQNINARMKIVVKHLLMRRKVIAPDIHKLKKDREQYFELFIKKGYH